MTRCTAALCLLPVWLPAATLTSTCTGAVSTCSANFTESASGNSASVVFNAFLYSESPATLSAALSQAFVTEGPVRAGYMVFDLVIDGEWAAGASSFGSGVFGSFSCQSGGQNVQICYLQSKQAITLGTALPIAMSAEISRGASFPGILSGGTRQVYLSAMFYEDGGGGTLGAAVPVSLIPEASSFALMGAAAIAWVVFGRNGGEAGR